MVWMRQKRPHKRKKMVKDQRSVEAFAATMADENVQYVIGIDEVGWGAIAGPLILGCVVYKVDFADPKIKDSKAFTTERSREKAFDLVMKTAVYTDLHYTYPSKLSNFGAGVSLRQGLTAIAQKAVDLYPDSIVVIDGKNSIHNLKHRQTALDKADTFVTAVSAASIIAKVTRDRYMSEVNDEYPEYEWHQNKGYPTDRHLRFLRDHGVCSHHRLNVSLVKTALEKYGTYGSRHSIGDDS